MRSMPKTSYFLDVLMSAAALWISLFLPPLRETVMACLTMAIRSSPFTSVFQTYRVCQWWCLHLGSLPVTFIQPHSYAAPGTVWRIAQRRVSYKTGRLDYHSSSDHIFYPCACKSGSSRSLQVRGVIIPIFYDQWLGLYLPWSFQFEVCFLAYLQIASAASKRLESSNSAQKDLISESNLSIISFLAYPWGTVCKRILLSYYLRIFLSQSNHGNWGIILFSSFRLAANCRILRPLGLRIIDIMYFFCFVGALIRKK